MACHCGKEVSDYFDAFTHNLCQTCYSADRGGLTAHKVTYLYPVSAEQLIDAGMEPPPGYVPRPFIQLTRRQVMLMRWHSWVYDARRRIGFWIAGWEPEEW